MLGHGDDPLLAREADLLAPLAVPIFIVRGDGWRIHAERLGDGWRLSGGDFPTDHDPAMRLELLSRALAEVARSERLDVLAADLSSADFHASQLAAARLDIPLIASFPFHGHPLDLTRLVATSRGWSTLVCRTESHARMASAEKVRVIPPHVSLARVPAASLPFARPRVACLEAIPPVPSFEGTLLFPGPLSLEAHAMLDALGPVAWAARVGVVRDWAAFFRACDVIAFLSRESGLPAVLPEALRSGRPVLVMRGSAAACQFGENTIEVDDEAQALCADYLRASAPVCARAFSPARARRRWLATIDPM